MPTAAAAPEADTPAPPRLIQYRGRWCIYYCRRRVGTGAASRAEAERFLRDFAAELARPQSPTGGETVDELLPAYLAARNDRKKKTERMGWSHKQIIR
jgi:hypothetical protein